MKTKEEIVDNWLPRYTDTPLKEFGKYILLVNFEDYLRMFSEWYNVPIRGLEKPMPNVTAEGITLINFGMGSPNAATIMDLLSAVKPEACLLLGPMPKMNLKGINWVIVGGESGPGARPLEREWVVGVRDQCKKARVPFFFKQWGGVQKKKAGRLLDGRTWDEMPRELNLVRA